MRRLDEYDWKALEAELDEEGVVCLPGLLSAAQCDGLTALAASGLGAALYARLTATANRWEERMGSALRYPANFQHFLVTRHNVGGECAFPLQVTVLLGHPGVDFTGGELVLMEQRPRMQTRPIVVPLRRGDAAVFAAHRRPHKGSKGYYQTQMKHAISAVHSGSRMVLDLPFHDAP